MSDSSMSGIFVNGHGELRSGWRALAFFLIFAMLLIIFGVVLPRRQYNPLTALMLNGSIYLAAAISATAFCARLIERRSFASVGYKLHRGWLRDVVLGVALGAIALGAAVAVAAIGGAVKLKRTAQAPNFSDLSALLFSLLIWAAFEELLFRGFAFQTIARSVGSNVALALSSVAFGLAHLMNPGWTLLSTANTVLAGLWLGTAYLARRSLWLPTALHWSWNLTTVIAFGLPISGVNSFEDIAWFDMDCGPPLWLSGGNYGPEGGLAATIAIVASTMLIKKSGFLAPSEEMLEVMRPASRKLK
jgi:membrane protease YdiL (CAAX protease family)